MPITDGFQFWTDVQSFAAHDRVNLAMKCGAKTVNLLIELPGEFTLFKGSAPEMTPKKRDAIYVRSATSSAVIRFSFKTN